MITPVRTTFELYQQATAKFGDKIALQNVKSGKLISYSYEFIYQQANNCAAALVAIGIKEDENVGVISGNRIEWCILDLAISMIGAVNVSLFPNYEEEDFIHIINDAGIKKIFVANKLIYQFINSIKSDIHNVNAVYSFDEISGVISLDNLIENTQIVSYQNEVRKRQKNVNERSIYTIFYTSGTGGKPKGVLMPHQSMVNAAIIMGGYLNLCPEDKSISFISISHAYERGHYFGYMHYGVGLVFAEVIISPIENLKKYQPTVFTTVPLLLQKIQDAAIQSTVDWIDQAQAVNKAFSYEFKDEFLPEYNEYKLFFEKWRLLIGQQVRAISCAGAPLPDITFRFICSIGIKLQEIYGLSECFAVTCGRYPEKVRFGTVGAIGDGVEIKISEEGEIIVKSSHMMSGFYNLPEYTKKVLDENGWFKTGDKGELIDGIFLRLTGRKKDIFKISSGMYISPVEIEKKLNNSHFINSSLVFEKDGNIAALIVPETNEVGLLTTLSNFENRERKLFEIISNEIEENYNKTTIDSKKIKHVVINTNLWTVEGGELTPTMKIKRNYILKKNNLI